MAKKAQEITYNPDNVNAWRKQFNPNAADYTFGVDPEKDKEAVKWSIENGYDNSKDYTTKPAKVSEPAKEPEITKEDLAKKAAETGESYLSLYQKHFPKPQYDSNKAKNVEKAQKLSVLADIIKTVGEGVTTSKGGTPIQRQSVTPQLTAELARLNEKYKSELNEYNKGGFNALLMDQRKKDAEFKAEQLAKQKAIQDAQRIIEKEQDRKDKKEYQNRLEEFRRKELKLREKSINVSASKGKSDEEKTSVYIDENKVEHNIPKENYVGWSRKVAELASNSIDKKGDAYYPDGTKIDSDILKRALEYPDNALYLLGPGFVSVQNGKIIPKQPKKADKPTTKKKVVIPTLVPTKTIPGF